MAEEATLAECAGIETLATKIDFVSSKEDTNQDKFSSADQDSDDGFTPLLNIQVVDSKPCRSSKGIMVNLSFGGIPLEMDGSIDILGVREDMEGSSPGSHLG